VRNAADHGMRLEAVDLRAASPLSGGQVDDTPYGGGAGMVIRVDVVEAALRAHYGADPLELRHERRVVALAAGGRPFDDALAAELVAQPALTLLCGRYEGFDERVHEAIATDVVSIGPYVLSGGELAAMVVCDAVVRKLPGALGHEESTVEESFSPALGGAPEYPHYTRPAEWRGHAVPDVLLSGDHARVRAWREEQSRERLERLREGEGGP
jgi:tRNA (guanine37-N1)-methyltransferase